MKIIAQKLGLNESFIFQQYNDPMHTDKHVKKWLIFNGVKQLHTHLQSKDLNPIEHLCHKLVKRNITQCHRLATAENCHLAEVELK